MQRVEIHILGHIDDNWQEWFEGFTIDNNDREQAIITGDIDDQTSLYTLLNRLERLGILLVSLFVRDLPDTGDKGRIQSGLEG